MTTSSEQTQSDQQPQPVKLNKDGLDGLRHAIQRVNDRISPKDLRFSERYVDHEIHILLQFRCGNSQEYVALLQATGPTAGHDVNVTQIRRHSSGMTTEVSVDHLSPLPLQHSVAQ